MDKSQENKAYYQKRRADILAKRKADREAIQKLKAGISQSTQVQNSQVQNAPSTQVQNAPSTQIPKTINHEGSEIPVLYPKWNNFLYKSEDYKYIQRNNELKELDMIFESSKVHVDYKKILLVGGSGLGKTMLAKYYSAIKNNPAVFLSCHAGIEDQDFLGSVQIVNGSSAFVLGTITSAIHIANNSPSKTCVIILDELTALTPQTQKILNENLNTESGLYVPKLGMKFRLEAGAKIFVLATANPSSYAGTYPLNAELGSRFKVKMVNDYSKEELTELLKSKYGIDNDLTEKICQFKAIMKGAYGDTLTQNFDIREVCKFIEQYLANLETVKEKQALDLALEYCVLGKFILEGELDQVRFVNNTLESVFATSLKIDY